MIALWDIVERGMERVTTWFKASSNFVGLLTDILAELQVAEDASYALIYSRLLSTASGQHLDNIGLIVGERRRGATDATYRTLLGAAILRNTSDGTPDRLLDILAAIVGASSALRFQYVHPFTMEMEYSGTHPDGRYVREFLQQASRAGWRLWPLMELGDDTPFRLGTLDDPASGSPLSTMEGAAVGEHTLVRMV